MNRRKAREQAVCLVYERAFHPELATEQFYEEALADREIPEDTFLHELFFTCLLYTSCGSRERRRPLRPAGNEVRKASAILQRDILCF